MTWMMYEITSGWSDDNLDPAGIAAKALDMTRGLSPLSTAMSNWRLFDVANEDAVPLSETNAALAAVITSNMWRSDFDGPDPDLGYSVLVRGDEVISEEGGPTTVHIAITTGAKWQNTLRFEIGSLGEPRDSSLITYPIYRGALETFASVWPLPWALAYSWSDAPPVDSPRAVRNRFRYPFELAWIAYLSAPLVKNLAPPPELVCQRTPAGGMILSAVETRIDQANPDHMRRSRLLQAIMTERVGLAPQGWAAELPVRQGPY